MDGEAHTVIAGMRAQQEDGEDAMGGGSYNGGGQDPMIPQTSFVAHSDSIILVIASQCNLWVAADCHHNPLLLRMTLMRI